MNNKVCHITTLHSDNDNRIFHKECISLKNNGFQVYLICANSISRNKRGINIIGIPGYKNRLRHFLETSFFRVIIMSLKLNATVYHFHDPELIFSGIVLKILGKKVVYDIHEDNPSSILSKPYLRSKFFKKTLSFSINFLEKVSALIFSKIVTARPDISKKFASYKPVTIRNLPIIKKNISIKPLKFKKNKKVVIFAGNLSKIRGIRELILSFYKIKGIELWLLGPWESESFKKECQNLNGWANTRYLGIVEPDEIYSYLNAADIGIITFLPYPNHIRTLATKPFEYMLSGLPIIMSNFEYWQKFFGDLSIYVDPKKPKEIRESIIKLILNPKKMKMMGFESRKKVLEEYNWNLESKKLIKLYKNLTKY